MEPIVQVNKRLEAICDLKDDLNEVMHTAIKEIKDIKLNEIPTVKGLPKSFIDNLRDAISDTRYSIENAQSEVDDCETAISNAYGSLDDCLNALDTIQDLVGNYLEGVTPDTTETDAMSKTPTVTPVRI